jgi:hypothetical protein
MLANFAWVFRVFSRALCKTPLPGEIKEFERGSETLSGISWVQLHRAMLDPRGVLP